MYEQFNIDGSLSYGPIELLLEMGCERNVGEGDLA